MLRNQISRHRSRHNSRRKGKNSLKSSLSKIPIIRCKFQNKLSHHQKNNRCKKPNPNRPNSLLLPIMLCEQISTQKNRRIKHIPSRCSQPKKVHLLKNKNVHQNNIHRQKRNQPLLPHPKSKKRKSQRDQGLNDKKSFVRHS